MPDCRIVVNSCPSRAPLQEIFKSCFDQAWPDCPYPKGIISSDPDVGWNANLIPVLEASPEEFILMMLDDNFLAPSPDYTANIERVIQTMKAHPEIAFVKLQAGGAAAPEIQFAEWDRIREYDRRPHPFKRTNLIPAIYRRKWLLRLSKAVLAECGPHNDIGRSGAIEFEVTGTKLTQDPIAWPERMFGIHRPNPDGGGGHSLLECHGNDAVTGGKIRSFLRHLCEGVPGAEVYL